MIHVPLTRDQINRTGVVQVMDNGQPFNASAWFGLPYASCDTQAEADRILATVLS